MSPHGVVLPLLFYHSEFLHDSWYNSLIQEKKKKNTVLLPLTALSCWVIPATNFNSSVNYKIIGRKRLLRSSSSTAKVILASPPELFLIIFYTFIGILLIFMCSAKKKFANINVKKIHPQKFTRSVSISDIFVGLWITFTPAFLCFWRNQGNIFKHCHFKSRIRIRIGWITSAISFYLLLMKTFEKLWSRKMCEKLILL